MITTATKRSQISQTAPRAREHNRGTPILLLSNPTQHPVSLELLSLRVSQCWDPRHSVIWRQMPHAPPRRHQNLDIEEDHLKVVVPRLNESFPCPGIHPTKVSLMRLF